MAIFYTEGALIKYYRASSPIIFSQVKKTFWLNIARSEINENSKVLIISKKK